MYQVEERRPSCDAIGRKCLYPGASCAEYHRMWSAGAETRVNVVIEWIFFYFHCSYQIFSKMSYSCCLIVVLFILGHELAYLLICSASSI